MDNLTTNISRHEVECHCGCGFNTLDYATAIIIQDACDYFSKVLGSRCVLRITSGCRCLAWNDHENGSGFSQHLYGRAVDHYIVGVSTDDLYGYYASRHQFKLGLGKYKNFVHLDTKSGQSRRWVG